MDDIPKGRIQNVDNAALEAMEMCLTNEIVVNKILQHCSNRRLLHCSLVNKLWNYEARNVMRKRGNLFAIYKTRRGDQCKVFEDLELDLQRMNVIPFDGIRIELRYDDGPKFSCLFARRESNFEAVMQRLTLKNFSVSLQGSWWNHQNCPGLRFTKRVFHHFSPVLETLYLDINDNEAAFVPNIIQHASFPHLKILKLGNSVYQFYQSRTVLVRQLLSRVPNLQQFHCRGDINHIGRLMEASSAVLVYSNPAKAPFDEISDNIVGSLRLENMRLEYTGPQFNFERFNRITPMLLQISCATTLREIKVDAVLAVPLMSYGVCLQNVNRLEMIISYDQLELTEPRIVRIVKKFDFTRIFPSLDKITIRPSQPQLEPNHMNRIIADANAVLREPLPDRAINIKKLDLKATLSHAHACAQFYAEMLPSIHDLLLEDDSDNIPFGSIWKNWQDLQHIRVKGKIAGNLDSVFCGIFPEEVAELQQMDKDYLGKVNIVPVMPAMTCLRGLRNLTLDLKLSPVVLQDPTSLFSNVTKLIAFKRLRGLSVYIYTYKRGVRARKNVWLTPSSKKRLM